MKKKLEIRFKELSEILLNELNDEGFWTGQLSSSALGVSVAVAALHFYDAKENHAEIRKGFTWLKDNINADGSFGDTPESPGNISTSLLVYAALNLYSDQDSSLKHLQSNIADYLQKNDIDINSDQVAKTILAHYKTDYTFSVPILTMSALCGIPTQNGFKKIPQLPFELALLPQKFYRLLNFSVVSYAIPALIAVGIVIFKKKRSGKFAQWIRKGAERKTLKILQNSMPQSGGFLEAIPLTAFVALSLINAGYKDLEVVKKGIQFLKQTQRDDGGWPIDVDLSTWVTTLSIKALGSKKDTVLNTEQKNTLTQHLKTIQNKIVHPFNGTSPGGWGWTNYSGSVPDADDTPGAILALLQLQSPNEIKDEVLAGANWLIKLQNTDGGFPTFSKGWGKLPFDQSCSDLTGHCFLALAKVLNIFIAEIPLSQQKKINRSLIKAAAFLQKQQQKNGSWLPLWFGNQHTSTHENPVYGTARVLTYLNDSLPCLSANSELKENIKAQISRGENFLIEVQNNDGSWGGDKNIPGTMEETALSVSALSSKNFEDACTLGLNWLDQSNKTNGLTAAPIGLYFASLWYDEKMYPLTAYLEAITRSLKS
ncbi:hypothetical protein OU798_21675 [Prolixibacteraceae bacterium Z1-6]|uniref:Squalene--hopene cyclase n=1 Tax=Draconibacterium aestuarii TaxID=2998507 RepID=A0A9X3FAW9_9BACT|nr:hypothetical protein [Prolixibacteraceae bacterium Z1-6]